MPNEYIFRLGYQNKFTGINRYAWLRIFTDCETNAFNLCLNGAYEQLHSYESLSKIELIYTMTN